MGFIFTLRVLCQREAEVKYSKSERSHRGGWSETFGYLLRPALRIHCVLQEFY